MRRLGVYGYNLPTKTARTVTAADFGIAGLIANCSRKYNHVFSFENTQDAETVLGPQIDSSTYGWDAITGFFSNLRGNDGTLYIFSYPGTGAVQATSTLEDQQSTPEDTLEFKAAYETYDEYGTSANRTGYTLASKEAYQSAITTLPVTGALTTITLESVAKFVVGDVLKLYTDSYTEYHYITAVNESAKTISWTDSDFAGTDTDVADWTASKMGLEIHVYRKDTTGVVTEVDKDIGNTYCTFNSNDADHYIESVFKSSSYLSASKLSTSVTPTAGLLFPEDVDTVTYLTGGVDGTDPTTADGWETLYEYFDTLPVRMIANVETSVTEYQSQLESYCNNRETKDNPVAIICGEYDLTTKAEVASAGQNFQRSDEVDSIYIHNWFAVSDPFADSSTAPYRAVPNCGHVMGWIVAGFADLGIHAIPAKITYPIKGVYDVYGYTADDDLNRTDLAESGVNVAQKISGYGICVRNLFTGSTAKEFRYANVVFMRNYIKVSGVDSLKESENTPNDIGHVREDRMAMLQFMNKLWLRGSNGNIKEGETFGQYENEDGTLSTKDDAFEVIGDASNNPVDSLEAGERNIDTYFSFPAPAGSIRVGVGVIYHVS